MGERRGNGWSVKRSENTQYLSSSWSYMGEVHGAPNNNCIKDHWSQIIITNIVKMKTFKMLPELPKCDTETQSEQMLLAKWCWIDLLATGLPQTFILSKKKAVPGKHNKAQQSHKTRYAWILFCLYFLNLYKIVYLKIWFAHMSNILSFKKNSIHIIIFEQHYLLLSTMLKLNC